MGEIRRDNMGLRNDGSRIYDYNGMELVPSVQQFQQAERRIEDKKRHIDDMKNELDLLENQAFNLYRKHVFYWDFNKEFIDKAAEWLKMIKNGTDSDGNKLDKRKKYDEKNHYDYLNKDVQKLLGIDDIEISEILHYNWDEAEELIFNYKGYKWSLNIPMIDNVKIESYLKNGDWCFKLRLYIYPREHWQEMVGSTYIEDNLKDIMAKAIEKYCDKEE